MDDLYKPYFDPDYRLYTVVEALTPHEIACILMGVDPATTKTSGIPAIPPYYEAEHYEWDRCYRLFERVVRDGIENNKLTSVKGDKCNPKDAIRYLLEKEVGEWKTNLASNPFVIAIKPGKQDRLIELEKENAALKSEILKLDQRYSYQTKRLSWIYRAIDEWYSTPDENPPDKLTLEKWLKESARREGAGLNQSDCDIILGAVRSDEQRKGGRPPKRDA